MVIIDYILSNFGRLSSVIFDGYESELSTKEAEQARRETKGSSGEIYFDHNMIPSVTQQSFLLDKLNKSRLISMLREKCIRRGINTEPALADVDFMIAAKSSFTAEEN